MAYTYYLLYQNLIICPSVWQPWRAQYSITYTLKAPDYNYLIHRLYRKIKIYFNIYVILPMRRT